MSYRPYPNADRALRQVKRHRLLAPVIPPPGGLRVMAESFGHLRAHTRRALKGSAWRPDFVMDVRTGVVEPFPVDEYRLSTRPGVVGGGQ